MHVTESNSSPAAISTDVRGTVTVLRQVGDIDLANSDTLRVRCVELLDSGVDALVLDFSEVTFFASSGIAVLAHVREYSAERGGLPVHVVAGRSVRRSLELTAMDRLLPMHDTVEDAVRAAEAATR